MSRFLSPALEKITPYTPGEQPKGGNLIKLNTNESPFPPSPGVIKALSENESSRLNLYSDPTLSSFTDALSERFQVNKDQVYAGNGSDEVLAVAMYAFGADGFYAPDITYGFYPVIANFFGISYHTRPLKGDFTICTEDFFRAPGAVVIANPNAPTGISLPLSEIERILRENPDHVVIVDEAYVEFGGESAAKLISKYEQLLVIGTFSKAWNLAGARLGYAVGNAELIRDMNRLRFSFHPYNINRLSLIAGTKAVEEEEYYIECRKKIIDTRVRTIQTLVGMGFIATDSKANFIFVKPPIISAKELFDSLRARGIITRYFSGARVKEYLRITIGSDEQMDALLYAVSDILKEAKK
ncbi:MAG: histidinol-phosphate transaminase [Clostridia bacterium]|nr:histidinol-phosphate transaminase [Clostridia bacterium]